MSALRTWGAPMRVSCFKSRSPRRVERRDWASAVEKNGSFVVRYVQKSARRVGRGETVRAVA
jgi:hypothetical protein